MEWKKSMEHDPLLVLFEEVGTFLDVGDGRFRNMFVEKLFNRTPQLSDYAPGKIVLFYCNLCIYVRF